MLNIITACSRQKNLSTIFRSINFDLVDNWFIVYDTSKSRSYNFMFKTYEKIKELECDQSGVCGHPQINYALDLITSGFVYILDDDNLIHPNFWNILPKLDINSIYTWDQSRNFNLSTRKESIMKGGNITKGQIDTAQFIVPIQYIDKTRWVTNERCGDFKFISSIHKTHKSKFVYIPKTCSYWNHLQTFFLIDKKPKMKMKLF